MAVAALAAHWLRSTVLPALLPGLFTTELYPLRAYLPLVPLAVTIWGALLLISGEYRSHRTVPLLDEAWDVVRTSITGSVVFTLMIYVFRLDEALLGDDLISRSWILLFSVLACLLVLAEKVGAAAHLALLPRQRLQLPHRAHRRHRRLRRRRSPSRSARTASGASASWG